MALGPGATANLTGVVPRMFCGQREVEGCSSKRCCYAPQSDMLVIQDCGRASLDLVVKLCHVPHVILDPRAEGYDRTQPWTRQRQRSHQRRPVLSISPPTQEG